MSVYPFIEAEKAGGRNAARACALLKVSRAAFYSHLAGPSRRDRDDAELTGQIQAVHQESRGRYGAPRAHAGLRRRGRRLRRHAVPGPHRPVPGTTLFPNRFASIKGELLDHQAWPTRALARWAIVEYIAWYDGTRLHSTLGYRSPAEFEETGKIKKVA